MTIVIVYTLRITQLIFQLYLYLVYGKTYVKHSHRSWWSYEKGGMTFVTSPLVVPGIVTSFFCCWWCCLLLLILLILSIVFYYTVVSVFLGAFTTLQSEALCALDIWLGLSWCPYGHRIGSDLFRLCVVTNNATFFVICESCLF